MKNLILGITWVLLLPLPALASRSILQDLYVAGWTDGTTLGAESFPDDNIPPTVVTRDTNDIDLFALGANENII